MGARAEQNNASVDPREEQLSQSVKTELTPSGQLSLPLLPTHHPQSSESPVTQPDRVNTPRAFSSFPRTQRVVDDNFQVE